jgi:hypothetical protein
LIPSRREGTSLSPALRINPSQQCKIDGVDWKPLEVKKTQEDEEADAQSPDQSGYFSIMTQS